MDDQPVFTPEEIRRGEGQAWHMPKWGRLVALVLVIIVVIVLWQATVTSTDL
jgi:hypothetical protein